jgi:hypothetical protein
MPMTSRRSVARVTFCLLVLGLSISACQAGTLQGSPVIPREALDIAFGQVYIYAGGFFDSGETVTTFSWLGISAYPAYDFVGQRYMTPLLFEETSPGIFVVRGIGGGQTVTSSGAIQSFNFNLQEGIGTTTNGLFTFGFINALVDASGNRTATSEGTVSVTETVEPGPGVGGPLTNNDWVFTPTLPSVTVGLGKSFGRPGTVGATYALNPGIGDENTDRTYSATLNGVEGGVPEPGTFPLGAGGAVLLLAGLVWRRRARGLH